MSVKQPADISATFAKLLNDRDRRGLLDLYLDDAILTVDRATIARGKTEIEKMTSRGEQNDRRGYNRLYGEVLRH